MITNLLLYLLQNFIIHWYIYQLYFLYFKIIFHQYANELVYNLGNSMISELVSKNFFSKMFNKLVIIICRID